MTRSEILIAELNKLLDNIRNKIKGKKLTAYEADLVELGKAIQSSLKCSHDSFFLEKNGIVKCIMKITNKINREITSVEIEMHGVANYSRYESKRVTDIEIKQQIKNDLHLMMRLVVMARAEVRRSELSGLAKMS
ncbi:MAG: hypothetical protein KIT56_03810 [Gammaproteobacteria bacterium]|nr:hypothetical protein [Gammaproteobacteria bacterium]MCW5583002.1 hypothetical protein [Gammaproteobacteria bacterium]